MKAAVSRQSGAVSAETFLSALSMIYQMTEGKMFSPHVVGGRVDVIAHSYL